MAIILTIDIGTSSVKTAFYDTDLARILYVTTTEYPLYHPEPNRAEQDPEEWWSAVVDGIQNLLTISEVRVHKIEGVGLTGQMHGTVLLDSQHQLAHRAIIWADQRSEYASKDVLDLVGSENYLSITGTLPAPGFMVSTLHWLNHNDKALFQRVHKVILPKDYIRLRLTGEIATDISDASGTGLLDISNGQWSDTVIDSLGLPRHIFPTILQSTDISGHITQHAAEQLGIPLGIPVAAGCADQPAQAIANGLIRSGQASITIGSGGQVFLPIKTTASLNADRRIHVFNHAVPQTHYLLGATLSAGLSLRWLRDIVSLNDNPSAYKILSGEAAQVPPGSDGLLFLPYLKGERTPHMTSSIRGGFIGLGSHHTRGHLARAVMEGVAFSLREVLEICLSIGESVDVVLGAGGGMKSDVWRSIQADILGIPLQETLNSEETSTGVAIVAGISIGAISDFTEAIKTASKYGETTFPNVIQKPIYDELYTHYRQLYPLLREQLEWISNIGD